MKRTIISVASAFLLLLGAGNAAAQNADLLKDFYDKVLSSSVNMSYSYSTMMSGVKVKGNHTLEVQNDLWHMKGNGLEIWCDGSTVWTTDPVAREVIIDHAALSEEGDLSNPALLLVRLEDWFDVKEERRLPDGKSVLYILVPKPDEEINIEYFNIVIRKSDKMPVSGSFALDDGTSVDVTFISMAMTPKKPVSYYRPSQSFDSSWIVTDLR